VTGVQTCALPISMNTASVQLVPPALLVAVMGLQVNELILPIILVTLLSLVVAISAARLLQRLPVFRSSDPNVTHPEAAQALMRGNAPPPDDAEPVSPDA